LAIIHILNFILNLLPFLVFRAAAIRQTTSVRLLEKNVFRKQTAFIITFFFRRKNFSSAFLHRAQNSGKERLNNCAAGICCRAQAPLKIKNAGSEDSLQIREQHVRYSAKSQNGIYSDSFSKDK
jgi:hypothetical protein